MHGRPARKGVGGPELADIFRAHGAQYRRSHKLSGVQDKAMRAIERCRTAALGGHVERCDACGALVAQYNPCRNRHCPKCQTLAKEQWLAARRAELLAVPYFHVVLTLPHALNPLGQGNPKVIYRLLFQSVAETLLEFGRDPRWVGGLIGLMLVLHTWDKRLGQHLHVHGIVPGGGLSDDGQRWCTTRKKEFFAPVRMLSKVFRGKFLGHLRRARERGELRFAGATAALQDLGAFKEFERRLREKDWVVYAKRPFAGPEQVLEYLGRYTHRVATSNERILGLEEGRVRFRYKSPKGKWRTMALEAEEFIRRFLLHVLPKGFVRIRYYGLLAHRDKTKRLARCRALLRQPDPPTPEPESVEKFMRRVAGIDIHRCPVCKRGRLHPVTQLPATFHGPTRTGLIPLATGPPLAYAA